MQTSSIIEIVVLVIIIILFIWLIYYTYYLQKPNKGSCDFLKAKDPSIKWSKDCSSILEITPDPTLKTPTTPLYLTSFKNVQGAGQPWGVAVYYRYVYVNSKTGGYGQMSPWTLSPVTAGSNDLPCLQPGKCDSSFKYTGKDSCNANLPQLKVDRLDYDITTSNIYANVHRLVLPLNNTKPPDKNAQGKIVGMLIPDGSGGFFIDISTSPCKEINCSRSKGC